MVLHALESWCIVQLVIEFVPDNMPVQQDDDNLFWVRRPLTEDEWDETLDLVLLKSGSPQWAKVET